MPKYAKKKLSDSIAVRITLLAIEFAISISVISVILAKTNLPSWAKISIGIACVFFVQFSSILIWRMHRNEIKIKDESRCWIPTCRNKPHMHGICQEHYNCYIVSDDEAEKIADYLFRMYNNNLKLGEEILSFTSALLHWTIPIHFKGHEHYPLENLFDYLYQKALWQYKQNELEQSRTLLSNLLVDFVHPENFTLFSVEAKISSIDTILSGDARIDSKFEKFIIKLGTLSLPSFCVYLLVGFGASIILFYLSSETNADGFIDPYFYTKLRFPLLIVYGLLVPIYFGIQAVRIIPVLYKKVTEGVFFSNKRVNNSKLGMFLDMTALLKNKRIFDISYSLTFILLIILGATQVIKDILAGSMTSGFYKVTEILLLCLLFYAFGKLRLFWKTVALGVELGSKEITIDIRNPDCIGGLKPYGNFLLNTFLLAILMQLYVIVILPYVFVTNHAYFDPSVFLLISLIPVLSAVMSIGLAVKTFRIFVSLHKDMISTKQNALIILEELENKAHVTLEEIRRLFDLKIALLKFKSFPISVNTTATAILKFIAFSVGGYFLIRLLEYLVRSFGRIL